MKTTQHSEFRIRKRVGVPKKVAPQKAMDAFDNGLRYEETKGKLRRYCDYLYATGNRVGSFFRLTPNNVYVFRGETLLTAIPLPHIYRDAVVNGLRKRTQEQLEKSK